MSIAKILYLTYVSNIINVYYRNDILGGVKRTALIAEVQSRKIHRSVIMSKNESCLLHFDEIVPIKNDKSKRACFVGEYTYTIRLLLVLSMECGLAFDFN